MFEAALKKLGMKLSDLDLRLSCHRTKPYALPWNPGICATAISDLVIAPSLAAGTLHRVKIDLPERSVFHLAAQGAICEPGGKSIGLPRSGCK